MTLLQWPSELPLPMRAGFNRSPDEARRLTKQDTGPVRSRRQWSKVGQTVQMQMDVELNLRARFERFHDEECSDGSLVFALPEPGKHGTPLLTSGGQEILFNGAPLLITSTWLCLFGRSRPSFNVIGVRWRIGFDLMVMPS